ncbi:MAG: hypothetical protein ABI910_11730 [Gemmatimonadota bacterium]
MARTLPWVKVIPTQKPRRLVPTDLLRILITDEERALLFSLSNYLTFRGCLVDCVERIDDARALVRHLHYDVVVVGFAEGCDPAQASSLTDDIRALQLGMRVVALAPEQQILDGQTASSLNVDRVVGRHLPLDQLAWCVCSAVAA